MQTSVEHLDGDRIKLTITVPAADVDAAISKAYAEFAKKLRIPGFRPGKAPRAVIDTHVGQDTILHEAQDEIVGDAFSRAVALENLRTIGQPEVGELEHVAPGTDYTFSAEVTLRPELKLASAENFTVTVSPRTATDREVDSQIEYTRERFSTLEAVEQPVGADDFALISFTGTVDGEAYEGNVVDKYLYELGRGMMPVEFDQALTGVEAGGTAVAEFEIPEGTDNAEWVGKTARFEIEVHEVKTKVLPALDDEFAATAGGFDSMEEYRADVRAKLDESKVSGHETEVEAGALAELTSRLIGEVPEEMVLVRANSMLDEFFERLNERGISIMQYLEMTGMSPDALRDSMKEQAGVRLREELALEALFRAKGMTVTDEQITGALMEMTGNDAKSAENLRETLTANGALPLIGEQIMHREAMKWLTENVTIEEQTEEEQA